VTDITPEIFFVKGKFQQFVIIDGPWYRRMTWYWNGETFVRDWWNTLPYADWGAAQDDLAKAWSAMRNGK
jgi:hypothetical protein